MVKEANSLAPRLHIWLQASPLLTVCFRSSAANRQNSWCEEGSAPCTSLPTTAARPSSGAGEKRRSQIRMPWVRYSARGAGGREISTATRPSGPHNVPPAGRAAAAQTPEPGSPAGPAPALPPQPCPPPAAGGRGSEAPSLTLAPPSPLGGPSALPKALRAAEGSVGPRPGRMDADGAAPAPHLHPQRRRRSPPVARD